MFDIAPSELVLVGAVALVVIGPKDLPRAMHFAGKWIGRARGMARHFRSGLDEIVRQAELEEMQKTWAAENARIMAEHPPPPPEEADDATYAAAPVMTPLPKPIELSDADHPHPSHTAAPGGPLPSPSREREGAPQARKGEGDPALDAATHAIGERG